MCSRSHPERRQTYARLRSGIAVSVRTFSPWSHHTNDGTSRIQKVSKVKMKLFLLLTPAVLWAQCPVTATLNYPSPTTASVTQSVNGQSINIGTVPVTAAGGNLNLAIATASLECATSSPVTVTWSYPANGGTVADIALGQGGANTSNGATIASMTFTVDGISNYVYFGSNPTGCGGNAVTGWIPSCVYFDMSIYAAYLSLGSHVLKVTATDTLGNVGSATVTANVIHDNPQCSGFTIGGGFTCHQSSSDVETASGSNPNATVTPHSLRGAWHVRYLRHVDGE